MSVPGLIGSQWSDLEAATEKRGSTVISVAPWSSRLGQGLHLAVVQVLADVRADQHDAARVGHVGAVRRSDALAVGQAEGRLARTTALRERRVGIGMRAEGLQHAAKVVAASAVREQRDAVLAVLLADRVHLACDEVEGLFPTDRLEALLAVLGDPQQRLAQAVGVHVGADAAGAAGTQAAVAVRVVGMTDDLPRLTVFLVQGARRIARNTCCRRSGWLVTLPLPGSGWVAQPPSRVGMAPPAPSAAEIFRKSRRFICCLGLLTLC